MSRRNYNRGTPIYAGIACSDQKRDLYKVAGFPEELDFDVFYSQFRRNGFARAGIMRPPQKCWSSKPMIYDHAGTKEPKAGNTRFEKELNRLNEKHDLFKWLYSLDYRQRVGRYGGIIVVAKESEGKTTKDPLKVVGGVDGVVGFRPVFEGQLEGNDIDDDFSSMNFGNPVNYSFQPNEASTSTKGTNKAVIHKSRVFVYAEGADDGSIYGTPALESGFNHLMDMLKVEVAGAEGLYKNARQRLHANITDENVASIMLNGNSEEQKSFNEALTDTAAGFDNEIITAGIDLKVLQSTMQDPTGAFNIALQSYCTSIDIPKTVLIGFENGERSSSENKTAFNDSMNSRRENVCTDMIKGFINHLIDIRVLPKPEHGICVVWDDLNSASDQEKMEISDKMATINDKSNKAGVGEIYTPDEIRKAGGYEPLDEIIIDGEE